MPATLNYWFKTCIAVVVEIWSAPCHVQQAFPAVMERFCNQRRQHDGTLQPHLIQPYVR